MATDLFGFPLSKDVKMSKIPAGDVPKFIRDIYDIYPRKIARPKAFDAIQKALVRLTQEKTFGPELLDNARGLYRIVRYFATTKRGQSKWCWHPATFFNQEHYLDNPAEWDIVYDEE